MTTPEFVDKVMRFSFVHVVWYGNQESVLLVLHNLGYAKLGTVWVPRELVGDHLEMLSQLVQMRCPSMLRKGIEIETQLRHDSPGEELKHTLLLSPTGCTELELRQYADNMFHTHPEYMNPSQVTMERGQYLLEIRVKKVKEGTKSVKRKRVNPITRESKTKTSLDICVKA